MTALTYRSEYSTVNKFEIIVGKPNFSDQFIILSKFIKKVGYNMGIMRQSTCLAVILITVYSYGSLFNCTTVGRASDSLLVLTFSFNRLVPDARLLLGTL